MKPGIKILDRYIFDTLASFFIFGIIIFSSVLMVSDAFLDLVRYVVNYGVPVKTSLAIIILRIPSLIVLTIPIGVLLSVLLTFNKLSTNSEITAMRTSGISLLRLAQSVLIFGSVAAVLSFMLSEYVVPTTNRKSNDLKYTALTQAKLPIGKTNFIHKELSSTGNLRRLFYINSYHDRTIEGIVMLDFTKDDILQVLTGKYAEASPDHWLFRQGNVYTISNKNTSTTNVSTFENLQISNNYEDFVQKKSLNYDELSIQDSVKLLMSGLRKDTTDQRKLLIKLYEKISIPFACICIALIGLPISISHQRAKINWGFPVSVCIIFIYYIIRSFTVPFGMNGTIDPFIAVWFPNLLLLLIGLGLLYYKNR